MNIMYCGDGYIERGVLISTLSLIENVPANDPLNIYVLTASVEGKAPVGSDYAEFLDALVKREHSDASKVTLVDITAMFKVQLPKANMETRFTPCCMLRLYVDEIPIIPDRILYLDNDVVCAKNCQELYETDLEDVEFAGVLDYYGRFFFRRNVLHMDYINSGVLLMNVGYMRQTGLLAKCRERCAEKKMFMPDQSSLNKLATSKKILPRRFNDQRRQHEDTVMRHFSNCFGFFPPRLIDVKPWQVDRMHSELKVHEYDALLERYEAEWARFEGRRASAVPADGNLNEASVEPERAGAAGACGGELRR